TGVITGATLRCQPVETDYMVSDSERVPDVDECMRRMLEHDDDYRYSVAWIDCMASGANLGRSVLTRGNHATIDDLPPRRRDAPIGRGPRLHLTAPPRLPDGLLNAATVRAFNELWFRRAPEPPRRYVEHLSSFFFPLDGVRGWNRIYGPRGLLQYQFVVPYGEERVVRTALERLSAARAPSFLAVLKRFEHDSRSLLGFPMKGWTLALDVPAAGEDLARLLDGLDELVVGAGGRVYLTKDARLRPELLAAMYPRLAEWRAIRDALDPGGIMCSDLDRRLDLTGRRSG
ncbi:MAG: decaprenylphosphoryl-beta-D-ribose oxidase, partial [Actinomycetota bacterium]